MLLIPSLIPSLARPAASALLLAGLAGLAATVQAQAPASSDAPPLPAFQTTGALHYACGGIGSDESTAMRAAMPGYPLSLLFARKNGDYLANLAVQVQGLSGGPQQFTATGPVCLLKLPPGRYTVKATSEEGVVQSQSVDVARNGHTLDFRY